MTSPAPVEAWQKVLASAPQAPPTRRPVAAIVVLLGRQTAAMWRGAMDDQLAGPTYANIRIERIPMGSLARRARHRASATLRRRRGRR